MSQKQRLLLLSMVPLLCVSSISRSQARTAGGSISTPRAVLPFIGCKSDGQVGPLNAPTGHAPPAMKLSLAAAQRLAYYKAENGLGVLAPRGWHCFSIYGSNGSSLFVSPEVIDAASLFSPEWKGFAGPAIQISVADGGTSGRFQVARVIAHVFPNRGQFVRDVIAEGIEPAASFPAGPYPQDKLMYRSKSIVEFETPANTEGLGTASRLQTSSNPIRGVAILLSADDTSLIQLSARLPEQDRDLTAAILQQVEIEATAVQSR